MTSVNQSALNQSAVNQPQSTPPGVDTPESLGDNKRVNVIFSPDTYQKLQALAQSQGINISDALRQAINVSDFVVKANSDPESRILVEKNGVAHEVKLV